MTLESMLGLAACKKLQSVTFALETVDLHENIEPVTW